MADRIVANDVDVTPGWIAIEGGRIAEFGAGERPGRAHERIHGTVIPGFVDMHVHGALGHDFGSADGVAARQIASYHHRHGTTTLLASLGSGSLESLANSIRTLLPLVEDRTLAGIHLEGPYLSIARRGAHNMELLRTPRVDEIQQLVRVGRGAVKIVTVAPELDGAEAMVRWLVAHDVTVGIGHTDCDALAARAALDWGARVFTHLFNGMAPLHHRHPGPVGVALTDKRANIELILDDVHLSPEIVNVVLQCAADRVVLVSDAMAATGCADGDFEIAGSQVCVRDGIATVSDGSSLAGSTATLYDGLESMLTHSGVSLGQAVAATSTNASATLGIDTGGLRQGAEANLVVLSSRNSLSETRRREPARVMRQGRWLGQQLWADVTPAT